jgi:hypothetical protein
MNSRRCNLRKKKHARNTTTKWLNRDVFFDTLFNPFRVGAPCLPGFPPVSPGVIHNQTLQVCFSMNTNFAGDGLENQGLTVFFQQLNFLFYQVNFIVDFCGFGFDVADNGGLFFKRRKN